MGRPGLIPEGSPPGDGQSPGDAVAACGIDVALARRQWPTRYVHFAKSSRCYHQR
jgi:hypothetical protein